jgi:cytochrome c oxidase cbb3-type subunit 2
MNLVAALLAGWALDRRWAGRTVFAGAAALLVACGLIGGAGGNRAGGAMLYAAGVSVYSTVLVFYPARGGRPWLAALIYAVAGWGGSALGIGLAENRHELPGLIIIAGTASIMGGLAARQLLRQRRTPA